MIERCDGILKTKLAYLASKFAVQGDTHTFLHVECCILICDHQLQVQEDLQEVNVEVSAIQALPLDPLTQWWEFLGSTWCPVGTSLTVVAMALVVKGCYVYCCVQGLALWVTYEKQCPRSLRRWNVRSHFRFLQRGI